MKKLTAGIFATILGLTAMGAADAAVTSKGYVDAAIKTVSATAEGLDGRLTAAEGKITTIEGEQTTQNNLIQANTAAIDAIEADYLKAADKTALQTAIDGKQDKLQSDMFEKDGTGNVVTSITATNGKVTYTTTTVATSDQFDTLKGRVDAIDAEQDTQDTAIGAAQAAAEAAQADATQALGDAADAQTDATKALEALKETSMLEDGQYTLTMKIVEGVPQYGWESIDRDFTADDVSQDTNPENDNGTATVQG